MWISVKFDEWKTLKVQRIVDLCRETCSKKQVVEMEKRVLSIINFDLFKSQPQPLIFQLKKKKSRVLRSKSLKLRGVLNKKCEEEDTLYLIIQLKKLLSCSEGDDDEEI